MNKFRRSLLSMVAQPPKFEPLYGKLDVDFKNNQFNSIGTKDYTINHSRGMVFENNNLILSGDAYFELPIAEPDYTQKATIQLLVEAPPTNGVIDNWFRFWTDYNFWMVFGYMSDAVINAKTPYVITFLRDSASPTMKTYINDVLIKTDNPSAAARWRYWMQIGANTNTPQPQGLTIRRFRIFDRRIDESEVKHYAEEMLANS